MKNLLIKLQDKRKEEKGFTLVELLVVIAILAILASVSVVGYMGFTAKAKQSNAVTELTQVKTVITTNLLDGKKGKFEYVVGSDDSKLYIYNLSESALNETEKDVSTELKNQFSDLKGLKGTFTATFAAEDLDNGSVNNDANVSKIVYTYEENVTATWTIATGVIA